LTPERYRRIKRAFVEACRLEPAQRAAYLDEACAGDAELRAEVEALLEHDEKSLPVKAPPLDSSLPAFYRILQLLEGGISKRKGRLLEGTADEISEKLFQLFLEEGVLKRASGEK